MRRQLAPIVGVLGFVGLLAAAAFWYVPEVERELAAQATSDLAEAGIDGAEISFDGRDGAVRGPNADLAVDRLDGRLAGARSVTIEDDGPLAAPGSTISGLGDGGPTTTLRQDTEPFDTVVPTTTTPDDTGTADETQTDDGSSGEATSALDQGISVTAIRDDGTIVLEGVVGSEDDRDILVREVERSGFLADDQLTIDESLDGDTAVEQAADVIRPVLRNTEDGSFTLEDGVVAIFGTASDPVAFAEIDEAAAYAQSRGVLIKVDIMTANLTEDQQVAALQAEIDQIFELARRIQTVRPTFEPEQDELNASATNILDRVAVAMRRYPLPTVDIIGHTDSVGPVDENQALSEMRASTVVDYLQGLEIDAERLAAIGRGELEPIASNDTPEGRLENRRVNFIVKKREG